MALFMVSVVITSSPMSSRSETPWRSPYLGQLYGSPGSRWCAGGIFHEHGFVRNASFEVIDLPQDIIIESRMRPYRTRPRRTVIDKVSFNYHVMSPNQPGDVKRYGSMDNVKAVISGQSTVDAKVLWVEWSIVNGQSSGRRKRLRTSEAGSNISSPRRCPKRNLLYRSGALVALVGLRRR